MQALRGLVNSHNVDRIVSAYRKGRARGDFLPAVFVLEPISRCDLSCIMCPNSKLAHQDLGEMSIQAFERIVRLISPVAEHVMLYFMGETLQHPNFEQLIEIARREIKGIITLSTNNMLLSGARLEAILEAPLDLIICCIDHWNREDYERIRVGGDFATVVANVETLLERKGARDRPRVIVKTLDFGMSQDDRASFSEYWHRRGATPLIGWIDTWAGQFPNLRRHSALPQPYANETRVPCADLWFKMIINWRGEVVICCHNYDYSIPLGALDHNSALSQVWQGSPVVQLREHHLMRNFACNSLCNGCSEWGKLDELDVYVKMDSQRLNLVF